MKTLLVSAIYTSPPTTMGGNTKIMLEALKSILENTNFQVIVFTTEPKTFTKYLSKYKNLKIIDILLPYKKFSILSHIPELVYIIKFYINFFRLNPYLDKNEVFFYSCSDWWADTVPIAYLKYKKYKFNWVSSLFLFIPDIFSNIKNKYNFPILKYFIYFYYQRISLYLIKNYSFKTIITNDLDKKFFPINFRKKLFAIYGGVNLELLENIPDVSKKYDAVFCGRLHPQKGPELLIDIWKKVVIQIPNANLIVIGNGEDLYTENLKKRVKELGIEKNLIFLGYVNNEEKFLLYKKSKIFLHTSTYDNNGMVAAEALCSGLPVVMFDHEYLKNIYTKYCIKVPVNNSDFYSEEIIKLLSDSKNYINKCPKGKDLLELKNFWDFKKRSGDLVKFIFN